MSKKYLQITSNLTEEAKQSSGYDNSFSQLQRRITFSKGCRLHSDRLFIIFRFVISCTAGKGFSRMHLLHSSSFKNTASCPCLNLYCEKDDEVFMSINQNSQLSNTIFSNYTFCYCISLWYLNKKHQPTEAENQSRIINRSLSKLMLNCILSINRKINFLLCASAQLRQH